jgi:hypothetical protein
MKTHINLDTQYRYIQRGCFVILQPTGRFIMEENIDPNSVSFVTEIPSHEFTVVEQHPLPIEADGYVGSNVWVRESDVNEILYFDKEEETLIIV